MDSHRSASTNDPSVDELLALHDKQHLKPIGAERKIGLLSSGSFLSLPHPNDFEMKDICSSFIRSSIYHDSSSSVSTSSDQSSNYSPRSSFCFIDPETKYPMMSTRTSNDQISYRTTSTRHPRIPLMSFRPTSRSPLPMSTAPFHCPRERFQVNSIGRPILRPHYSQYYPSHGYSYSVRR